ncbi:MAG: hypothetical protein Q7T87_12000 [Polaromonas sp.]|nr:hypothetical protein [Polaromonas sp.]
MPHRTVISIPATSGWNTLQFQDERKYANNEMVREWLVLRALAGSGVQMSGGDLQGDLGAAFTKVREGLASGAFEIDYLPMDENTVDIPAFNHPHHTQAMLYWSTRLGCTLSVLAEAHSRLGKSPTVDKACLAAKRIEKEERLTATWRGDAHGPHGTAHTMPMFQPTVTQSMQ